MSTLKLRMVLDTKNNVDSKLIKKRNGKLLVDIQGRLEVFVDGKCFFFEPSLALLEFGIALKKWKRDKNFFYYTIEHDEREGAILAFINNGQDDWKLFSIWQLFESQNKLTLDMISDTIDSFLIELDDELLKNYGFNINDFLNSKWFF